MKSSVKLCLLAVAVVAASVGARTGGAADRGAAGGQSATESSALQTSGDGRIYIKALAKALQESDRIVVTEHSNVDDILDPETQPQRPVKYNPTIYTSHELTPSDRAEFLGSIKRMPATTQVSEPACIFEPHHTISFYRGKAQTSAMRICFQCEQVKWDGTTKSRPRSLVPTLKTFLENWGMQAERDWRRLAKAGAK